MNAAAIAPGTSGSAPVVDVVVPVYNEAADLERGVRRLRAYLDRRFPFPARVTIVDNASTDDTWAIAEALERELGGVRAVHLPRRGRGGALASAWLDNDAEVLAYMDVDLSTDLDALLPLVAPLLSGHSEVAIGSRLAPGARVVRGLRRELISRAYNLLLRLTLGVRFRDAQCGFKAMRADVARRLVPRVENRRWFFDTELLVLAERDGLRIHEVPVDWTEDPRSSVHIWSTAVEDLRGVLRVGFGWPRAVPRDTLRQLWRFGLVGAASTLAYAGLYLLLRPVAPASVANAAALVATALANTLANRRLTFGVRGRRDLVRHSASCLIALVAALAVTNAAIAALQAVRPDAVRSVELAVLLGANGAAALVRFLVLRTLILAGHRPAAQVIELPRRNA